MAVLPLMSGRFLVEIPFPILREVSNKILNTVKGVNRVLFDISTKPPASIEWE